MNYNLGIWFSCELLILWHTRKLSVDTKKYYAFSYNVKKILNTLQREGNNYLTITILTDI